MRSHGVFMVATANFIDRVDAALQGRFSERFFVDLPGPDAREAIIRIHLAKMNRPDPEALGFDIPALVVQSQGYAGREIMEATLSAFRRAYLDKRAGLTEDITHHHLAHALAEVVPLSRQREADIRVMRAWGRTARLASSEPFDGILFDASDKSIKDVYSNLGRRK